MPSGRTLTPTFRAVLGFLAAVGPFATDLYLPALPRMAAELGVEASGIQLTLTAFLLGIGSGQLLWGPLSDRFGRRPVLLGGLVVFAAVSIGMVFVPNVETLIVLRALQGLSGSAGIVVARAIAVDLSPRDSAVRTLSTMAAVAGTAMLVAPLIGGATISLFGWRATLAALAVVTTTMLALAIAVVPESLPREDRHAGGFGQTLRRFGVFLRDRVMTGYILSFAFAFAAKMAYIAGSSFVAQVVLGSGPFGYALVFATSAAAYVAATSVNARIAPRIGAERTLAIGIVVVAAAGAGLVVTIVVGVLSLPVFIVCAVAVTAGGGFVETSASALALARAHAARGTGAALLGSTQFLFGAAISPIVGLAGAASALPTAVSIVVCMGLAGLAAAVATRSAASAPPA